MVFLPGQSLANSMASRRLPGPLSLVVVTVMGIPQTISFTPACPPPANSLLPPETSTFTTRLLLPLCVPNTPSPISRVALLCSAPGRGRPHPPALPLRPRRKPRPRPLSRCHHRLGFH